jgi:hypothetical protein
MLTATRLCGDQVGEYQARTDRGKHSSGSLEEASPPQPKTTPGPSFYHLSWQLLRHSRLHDHRSFPNLKQYQTTSITMEENRERQAAELTLLTTMYPSEFSWRNNPPPDLETSSTITSDPNFTLTIHRT